MRALFLHRSVGQQLVEVLRTDGRLGTIELWDYNANYDRMTNGHGVFEVSSSIHIQDGDTNPPGLERFSSRLASDRQSLQEIRHFDAVVFKSCYSACAIESDQQLAQYVGSTCTMVRRMRALAPDAVVLLLTPPPRRPVLTSAAAAQRARDLVSQMRSLASDLDGIFVCDLHGTLSEKGVLKRSYRRRMPYDQHPNRQGVAAGAMAFAEMLHRIADRLR